MKKQRNKNNNHYQHPRVQTTKNVLENMSSYLSSSKFSTTSKNQKNPSNSLSCDHLRNPPPQYTLENCLFPFRGDLEETNKDRAISSLVDHSASSKYAYKKKVVFMQTEWFKVIQAINKSTGQTRIAKIYDKAQLSTRSPSVLKSIKREILLLERLKRSQCLLSMEKAFETKNHIYLIFENGVFVDPAVPQPSKTAFNFDQDAHKLKMMLWDVLIAVCEVNAFYLSAGVLTPSMVVYCEREDTFKLFNLLNLARYGEKQKINWTSGFQESIYNGGSVVNSSTDTWAFGILMSYYFKFHTYKLRNEKFSREFLRLIGKDLALDAFEKDLFEGIFGLKSQDKPKIKICDIGLHRVFSEVLVKERSFKRKIQAIYPQRERIDLGKIWKQRAPTSRKDSDNRSMTGSLSRKSSNMDSAMTIRTSKDVISARKGSRKRLKNLNSGGRIYSPRVNLGKNKVQMKPRGAKSTYSNNMSGFASPGKKSKFSSFGGPGGERGRQQVPFSRFRSSNGSSGGDKLGIRKRKGRSEASIFSGSGVDVEPRRAKLQLDVETFETIIEEESKNNSKNTPKNDFVQPRILSQNRRDLDAPRRNRGQTVRSPRKQQTDLAGRAKNGFSAKISDLAISVNKQAVDAIGEKERDLRMLNKVSNNTQRLSRTPRSSKLQRLKKRFPGPQQERNSPREDLRRAPTRRNNNKKAKKANKGLFGFFGFLENIVCCRERGKDDYDTDLEILGKG